MPDRYPTEVGRRVNGPRHAASSHRTSTGARGVHGVSSGLRRHWLFAVVLFLAIVMRVIVTLAYRPVLMFPDSIDYLARAHDLTPMAWHPLGYPFFLWLLRPIGDITAVAVSQHLLVLADGVLLYVLLLRFGIKRWLAALGVAPLLLDAFQLNAEQWVLSEAWFESLVAVGLLALLWSSKPRLWQCAVAGIFFSAASITRFDGAILLLPALAYLLLRRVGILRIATLVLAVVLPIAAYAGWYDSVNGQLTVSSDSGLFLYGRISQIAECKGLSLPSYERPLCPSQPPVDRPPGNWYVSNLSSPARLLKPHDGRSTDSILTDFDLTIIEHQPLDLANHAFDDYVRQFQPTHQVPRSLGEPNTFFQVGYPSVGVMLVSHAAAASAIETYFGGPSLSANRGLDELLRDYQKVVYTWGPLLAVCQVLGLLAIVGVGRSRSSGRRAECLVLWLSGILVFFFSVASFEFSFRYLLPTLFLIPPAGVLAVAMIWPRFRSERWSMRGTTEPTMQPELAFTPDASDSEPSPRNAQPVDA
jgi:hypothetical protein